MKIIQVHNYYQQAGGEDAVVAAERVMLEKHGNIVVPFYKTNDEIGASSNKLLAIGQLLKASVNTLWNPQTYREFRKLLQKERPDAVHCHNTFPLISPSIYWACAKEKVPVVQTLHNYRLLCLNAFLFRKAQAVRGKPLAVSQEKRSKGYELKAKGSICELCVSKKLKWPGIKYRCYRQSLAGSLVIALMLFVHKLIGTYTKKVTAYIALTEFQKQKMIEGGLPANKVWVKPNFIDDREAGSRQPLALSPSGSADAINFPRDSEIAEKNLKANRQMLIAKIDPSLSSAPYALFVGRLSPEKGCDVLIRAWKLFAQRSGVKSQMSEQGTQISDLRSLISNNQKPQLLIVGDGPDREALEKLTSDLGPLTSVRFLGKQPKERVLALMRSAQFLVLPSLWYEGFPMTIVEAFSNGLPVVASNIGSMTSVIEHERNGLLFEAGSADDLAGVMMKLFFSLKDRDRMSACVLSTSEKHYSETVNIEQLEKILECNIK
jgi:glycosyltransferase involved in cell wall biosynthesis